MRGISTYESQQKTLDEWCDNWRLDQVSTIISLRRAAENDNHSEIMHMIDQLMGMSDKRFTALKNVFGILSDPDRELRHYVGKPGDPVPEESAEPPAENQTDEFIAEIGRCYNAGLSVNEISDRTEISEDKIIKILVTQGVFENDIYRQIKRLREKGVNDSVIADRLGLQKSAMNRYTPYTKGIYNLKNPSENAAKLRAWRQGKAIHD
ncbi:hypothetical protein EV209_1326 [Cuneatibacter caecimuris]|uniref:Uncharacterized protein n=2 Tax=Cuneatibacter caecimuris TaxID=1796618 RepID=A0A4Q7PLY1_9FIRM|nr:hypothetical protein EV209_1326 [Cuneatibacter caecimuris]